MNLVQEVSNPGHAEILTSSFGRTVASHSCCGSNQSEKVVVTSKSSRSSSAHVGCSVLGAF